MRDCIVISRWSWRIDLPLQCAKTGLYTQYILYSVPAYIESLAFPYVSVAARHGAFTRSLGPWVLAQLRRLDVLHSIQFPDIASPLSRRTAFVTAWPRRDLPAPNPKSACLVPDYRSYSTALSRLLAPRILRRLSTARTLPSLNCK